MKKFKNVTVCLELALIVFMICASCKLGTSFTVGYHVSENNEYMSSEHKIDVNGTITFFDDIFHNDSVVICLKNNKGIAVYKFKNHPDTTVNLAKTETDSIISGLYKIYIEGRPIIKNISKSPYASEYVPKIYNISIRIDSIDITDSGVYTQFDSNKMITYTEAAEEMFVILMRYKYRQRMDLIRKYGYVF